MRLRLRNQHDPKKTLSMNKEAWFGILELAEAHGWYPLGTVRPEEWEMLEPFEIGFDLYDPDGWDVPLSLEGEDAGNGSYQDPSQPEPVNSRLVLLEDALNLADALERAFLEYEPEGEPQFSDLLPTTWYASEERPRPSIGAVEAALDFARSGAFWIERYSPGKD